MSGLPDPFVYFLILGVFLLVRYLWRQRTRVRPWEEALSRRLPEAMPEAVPVPVPPPAPGPAPSEAPWSTRPASEEPWSTWLPEGARPPPLPASRPKPATVLRPATPMPRRFTRRTLFGTRRRTQNAVVASIILGPCRSMAPYTTDVVVQPAPPGRPAGTPPPARRGP